MQSSDRAAITAMLALLALLLVRPDVAAATCGRSDDALRLDWSEVAWPNGRLEVSAVADRIDRPGEGLTEPVDITVGGATSRLVPSYPAVGLDYTGGRGAGHETLALQADFSNGSQSVTLTLAFAVPVQSLSFELFDIDYLPRYLFQRGYRDGLTITGVAEDGTKIDPALRSPHLSGSEKTSDEATVYLGAPLTARQVVGYGRDADPRDDAGNIAASFDRPVRSVVIDFTGGLYPPSSNPREQGIALSDFEFCVALQANIEATKTQRVISETPEDCGDFSKNRSGAEATVPGACVEYRIRVTNTGAGQAEDLQLSDELNPNLVFRAAKAAGFEMEGAGIDLTTPTAGQDCGRAKCLVALRDANLPAGATGEVMIRATVR